jgi:hypothetical protein
VEGLSGVWSVRSADHPYVLSRFNRWGHPPTKHSKRSGQKKRKTKNYLSTKVIINTKKGLKCTGWDTKKGGLGHLKNRGWDTLIPLAVSASQSFILFYCPNLSQPFSTDYYFFFCFL